MMTYRTSLPDGWTILARRPPDDPVNLIFLGASAPLVSYILRREVRPGWHRTGWGRGMADLSLGQLFGKRRHIRIYTGLGPPPDPAWSDHDIWSVATVHLEHLDRQRRNHIIDSWNEPRDYVRDAFARWAKDRLGEVFTIDLGGGGRYHGQTFDGAVTVIELR